MPENSYSQVREKAAQYETLCEKPTLRHERDVADLRTAAFFWPLSKDTAATVPTEDVFRRFQAGDFELKKETRRCMEELASKHQFFHWHLAFPEVFAKGGFDCVLGNPPWDKIQPEEEKFFSPLRPDIANASTAKARKALIEALPSDDPATYRLWEAHKRKIDATCHFLRSSGLLRFTGEGNLNSYRIFTELSVDFTAPAGRVGLVAQSGLATDESGKELFDHLLSSGRLCLFLDFENRGMFFADVHQQFRFCLITIRGEGDAPTNKSAHFGWLLHSLDELASPNRLVQLTAADLLLFNPSSRTCPAFTSTQDLEVSRRIYRNGQHVMRDKSHRFAGIDFLGELFNLTRDSRYFLARGTESEVNLLPLYEAKYIHQFDHRFATSTDNRVVESTWEAKVNAAFCAVTSHVVDASEVFSRMAKRGILTKWLCGFRDIASATNERTVIMAVFPVSAVGNSINLVLNLDAKDSACLTANANSFLFDYCCRQKVSGTHVNIWIFKQLPAISSARYNEPCPWTIESQKLLDWLLPRVLELIFTAWDLEGFARDCSWSGPPFRWDEERRFLIRCELDAAFFHLYLGAEDEWRRQSEGSISAFPSPRHAVEYIMETFPIVKRKDEQNYGEYRTKRVIVECYDAMNEAMKTGRPYQTILDPPPADPRCCHRPREGCQA